LIPSNIIICDTRRYLNNKNSSTTLGSTISSCWKQWVNVLVLLRQVNQRQLFLMKI